MSVAKNQIPKLLALLSRSYTNLHLLQKGGEKNGVRRVSLL